LNNALEVKYFKSVTTIYLGTNNLTSLPQLKNFTNLQEIACDSNQLTSMIPVNHITTLQRFKCRKNFLTSLPSFAGLNQLTWLLCDNNQLTALPDLTGCTSLNLIVATTNRISTLPNLSTLTSLKRLILGFNLFTSFPNLSAVPGLQLIDLDHNLIPYVPSLGATNPSLNELVVHNNPINSVGSLSFITSPVSIRLENCKLTFDELIPMTTNSGFSTTYVISPQQKVFVPTNLHAAQNTSFTINLSFDNTVTTSTYYWYHDGNMIATTTTNSLTINPVAQTDAGTYYVRIVNSTANLTGVTLYTEDFDVIVDPCIVTGALNYNLTSSIDCFTGATIQIDETTLSGGTHPYHYSLSNQVNGINISYNTPTLDSVPSGKYHLNVYDATGCMNTFGNDLLVERPSACDAVISPNGDGVEDTYFISISGTARVYDKAAPGYFDGTDDQGKNVPNGLYLILVDEKTKLYVTVLR
jgi:internalin A